MPDFCNAGTPNALCTDIQEDRNNCGACGAACNADQDCLSGHCQCPANAPHVCGVGANSICTDRLTDANNCGACGTTCESGACSAGSCLCVDSSAPDTCGPLCTNKQTDPLNCGICGHICLSPSCSSGLCGQVALATPNTATFSLLLSGSTLYWTSADTVGGAGGIYAISTDGGGLTTVVTESAPDVDDVPLSLAVDSSNVYWTSYQVNADGGLFPDGGLIAGAVRMAALDGGLVRTLQTGAFMPSSIAVDSSNVYWTTYAPNGASTVASAPIDGGAAVVLSSGLITPTALVVHDGSLFWREVDGAEIYSSLIDGGSLQTVASNQPLSNTNSDYLAIVVAMHSIAVDDTNLYWTSSAGTGDGSVQMMALDGGTPTPLVSGQYFPYALSVDASDLLWVNGGLISLTELPLWGGPPMELGNGGAGGAGEADFGNAVSDGTDAYWMRFDIHFDSLDLPAVAGTTSTSLIWKTAK